MDWIYGHDDVVAPFVAQLIPECRERGFGRCVTLGIIDNDGHLMAGIVYHHYDPDAGVIEMSGGALPGRIWLMQDTLRRMYQYPFLQLGCQMVLMRVAADNER